VAQQLWEAQNPEIDMDSGNAAPSMITIEQVQTIVDKHRGSRTPISSFSPLQLDGFSALTPVKGFSIYLSDETSYILKVSPPPASLNPIYAPNTLSIEHSLVQLFAKHDDIPHCQAHAIDTTLAVIPYHYLLLSHPKGVSLAHAKQSGKLTDRQSLLLDLRIGSHLKKVHDTFQNDWFGLPSQEKEELYNWQEAFTWLLESLLHEAQEDGENIPYEELRKYLSRAIGFFLFDDCEVPSLVSFLGNDESIIVDFDPSSPSEEDEIQITSLVPLSHALWGDPLLETLFLEPSRAFLEGYGQTLTIFPRHKTKRLWYTLFLALVILVQENRATKVGDTFCEQGGEKSKWAREMLEKCVEKLKDAPCY